VHSWPPEFAFFVNKVLKRLESLYGEYGDWLWLVSFSGGKDSSALLFLATCFAEARGFKIAVVYNDTGGDPPTLRQYVYEVLEEVKRSGHDVHVTRPERTFFDYLFTEYSPPRWNFRWCCKRLKELPFKQLADELARERPVLNLLGTRREEARWRGWYVKRASDRLVYAAPLYDLTSEEVWALLRELRPDAYERLRQIYGAARRMGCWFCPLVRDVAEPRLMKLKLEVLSAWCSGRRERILELAEQYPDLIQVTVDADAVRRDFPCGRKCNVCQVAKIRIELAKAVAKIARVDSEVKEASLEFIA